MTNSELIVECKHVSRAPWNIIRNLDSDIHYAKLHYRYADGRVVKKLEKIVDFKRDFYITRERFRNHKQKKSWEQISRLQKYQSTEKDLLRSISRALGTWNYKSMRELSNNPYIYGTMVPTTSLIKHQYNHRIKDNTSPYSSLCLDIETSMVDDSVLMLTNADSRVSYTLVSRKFLPKGTTEEDINRSIKKYIGERVGDIDVRVKIVDSELDILKGGLTDAHRRQPDFLAIWNMDYDINVISKRLTENGLDPADVFSDPSVPPNERYYEYKEGSRFLVTTEGEERPKPPSMQWHSVNTPAHFYIIDMMCVYRRLIKDGNEVKGGFGLDNILKLEKIGGKLSFDKTDHMHGALWHHVMQRDYPIEYIVYNIWDSISMVKLEEKLGLLSRILPTFADSTPFYDFGSSAKLAINDFHYYALEKGYVLGTRPVEEENDPKLLGTKGWIITLPSQNIVDNGLRILKGYPHISTSIRGYTFDSDAVSAYPRAILATNCGKETTARELISIEGKDKSTVMVQNINITLSESNSVPYCVEMHNAPGYEQMLSLYKQYK